MTAPGVTVRRPLFRRYVGLFVAIVSLALLANGSLEIWFSYQEHKASLIRIQREQAEAAAAKIGQFVKEIENQLGWTTQLPWSASTVEQRRFDGLRLLRQVPAITELSMVDATGREQLRVSRLAMDVVGSGLDISKEPKFTEALVRKVYYGPVYFRRESEPYMTLALAGTRRDAGVSIAEVNLKLIWEVISKIKVGERGYAYVVDAQGRLIAHPDISLVLRNTDMSGLAQVRAARAGKTGLAEDIQVAENPQGRPMLTAHAPVAPLDWVVFVDMPLDEAYAPLYASIQRSGVLMLGALMLAAFAGLFLARRMIGPIRILRAGAERIGGGDLAQRIAVHTGDELEALAHQFNDMAGRLQESYADLERKVEERTRELQEALEYQTATSEVLNVISRAPSQLQPVFDAIVETAAHLCDAEYTLLYRLQDGKYHVAAANNVEAEFIKYAIEHPLPPGRGSLTGRTALENRKVHMPDCLADPEYGMLERQRVGKYRTVLGVPLLREGVTIGVIALMRSVVKPFTDKQVELVSTFADQAVIAIENVRLFEEVQARTRELSEALEQQTATSEVLQAISRSTFDLPTVLNTLVESVAKRCGADQAAIARQSGSAFHYAATYGLAPEVIDYLTSVPHERGHGSVIGRALLEGKIVQIPDVLADPEYKMHKAQEMAGFRTVLGVPLMREGKPIGVIALNRLAVQPFTQRQIDLVGTFADQAVIAIENVRLFDEVQARTRELQESLEYQTATSEVLNVISRSPSELQPVLDAIVTTAARLCSAEYSFIVMCDETTCRLVAANNVELGHIQFIAKNPVTINRETVTGRTALEKRTIHIPDVLTDPEFKRRDWQEVGKQRTVLGVPLLREGKLLGVMILARTAVKPFSDKQVDLVTTFADQAVIAINNVRLFEEVQARTRELQESLEYQTATSNVLSVISRSPNELEPVLRSIVETAAALCDGFDATILLRDGEILRVGAHHGSIPLDFDAKAISGGWITGAAVLDHKAVHVHDLATARDEFPEGYELHTRHRHRTGLAIPLLRKGEAIGAFMIRRTQVRPFTEKQIAVLQTFADQAVIAISNVRLFEEVQARTRELARSVEELTALGEVSRAVNSTLDLGTVLSTIVAKAVQLSGTEAGAIYVYSNWRQQFRLRATYGMSEELIQAIRSQASHVGDTAVGEAVAKREPLQVPDLRDQPGSPVHDIILKAGYRSLLIIPLLRPDRVVGALVVRRKQPGLFPKSTIDLLTTFAEQSVLAIQNARLFSEIEEKSRQIEIASRHKSQFLANMSHELRTPLNSVLGFTEMLADGLYGELPVRAKAALEKVQNNGRHLLALINDVLDLSKIEAGQLALTLDDYAMAQVVNSVVTNTESLARAKGLALTATVAPGLPIGRGDERRLTQVLINIVGNAIKFTDAGSVDITAKAVDGFFEIAVRDTGPGIAPEDLTRIFEEFQQVDDSSTRKKGGTGLGLAISKRIVEMHGGAVTVVSELGRGSTFRITVPVRAEEEREAA
jgi:GAF domain-containing protein/sensor histidine kinase YesM